MLKGKKILIGVTSGIAIYKVLTLISNLRKKGADVHVIMTDSAQKFINPITFETISNNKVYTDMWIHPDKVLHIDITNDIDLFLVAPATANTIAKVYAGIADNLLTTAILASKCPVSFAIATNTNMLENPITMRNINGLKDLGYDFIDSNEGFLACNTYGKGRMAEPEEILEYIEYKLSSKELLGKTFIVTAGATISRLDPVRFMTNDSSGKMGYEIAKNLRNRGARVIFIQGNVKTNKLGFVENIYVKTNQELKESIEKCFSKVDAIIMAAAPVDYEFEQVYDNKLKKNDENISFKMKKSIDILKHISTLKKDQKIIGFAAETNNALENAKNKLENKNLDMIVLNDVSKDGAGFDVDTNIVTLIGRDFKEDFPIMKKSEVANIIVDKLVKNVL